MAGRATEHDSVKSREDRGSRASDALARDPCAVTSASSDFAGSRLRDLTRRRRSRASSPSGLIAAARVDLVSERISIRRLRAGWFRMCTSRRAVARGSSSASTRDALRREAAYAASTPHPRRGHVGRALHRAGLGRTSTWSRHSADAGAPANEAVAYVVCMTLDEAAITTLERLVIGGCILTCPGARVIGMLHSRWCTATASVRLRRRLGVATEELAELQVAASPTVVEE